MVPIKLSLTLRLISVIGIYGQIVTMLCLAIERLVASLQPRTYERITSPAFAAVLVIVGTIFSFVFCCTMIVPGVKWSSRNVGFVIKTEENKEKFQTLIWFEMVPEVISLVLFHMIQLLNSPLRKRVAWVRDELDLASRYQIEENIKICTLLLPVFYTHFVIFFLTAFGIALFPLVLPNGQENDFAIFLELMAWSPFYALAMPVIVSIRTYYRRRQLLQSSLRGRSSCFQPLTELAEISKDKGAKYAVTNNRNC